MPDTNTRKMFSDETKITILALLRLEKIQYCPLAIATGQHRGIHSEPPEGCYKFGIF